MLARLPRSGAVAIAGEQAIYFAVSGSPVSVTTTYTIGEPLFEPETVFTGPVSKLDLPPAETGPYGIVEGQRPGEILILGTQNRYRVILTPAREGPILSALEIVAPNPPAPQIPGTRQLAERRPRIKPFFCGDFDFGVSLAEFNRIGIVKGSRLVSAPAAPFVVSHTTNDGFRSWSHQLSNGADPFLDTQDGVHAIGNVHPMSDGWYFLAGEKFEGDPGAGYAVQLRHPDRGAAFGTPISVSAPLRNRCGAAN